MAWVVGTLNRFVPNLVARSAATLVAPYAVYLLAEEVHFSGVVAVVVTALELGRRARPQDSEERLTRTAFWDVVELLTTGVAFGLVGIEMRYIIEDEGRNLFTFIPGIAAICIAVVLVRFLWMMAMFKMGGTERKNHTPGSLKEVLVLTWCGMRGLATLALALALPTTMANGEPLEGRNFVIATACAVLIVTLVVPGLTLPALMRALKLPNDHAAEERKQRSLARRAEKVALETMKRSTGRGGAAAEAPRRAGTPHVLAAHHPGGRLRAGPGKDAAPEADPHHHGRRAARGAGCGPRGNAQGPQRAGQRPRTGGPRVAPTGPAHRHPGPLGTVIRGSGCS